MVRDSERPLTGGDSTGGRYATLNHASVGSLHSGASDGDSALALAANAAVGVQETLREQVAPLFAIQLVWADLKRRQRSGYHHATILLGLALALLASIYAIVVELNHRDDADETYLSFVVLEVVLAGAFQVWYSIRGIALENASVLLIANLNAFALVLRIGMSVLSHMQDRRIDIAFTTVVTLLAAAHVATSGLAWGGEFNRFMMFCIGSDEAVQRMFRAYQMLFAFAALDIQLCILTATALVYFQKVAWWHYCLGGLAVLANVIARFVLRHVVRTERGLASLLALCVFYLIYAVFVVTALYETKIFGAQIPADCESTVAFTVVAFCLVRTAVFVAMFRCYKNWGNGMIDAFAKQKTAIEYLRSPATQFKRRFLTVDEERAQRAAADAGV